MSPSGLALLSLVLSLAVSALGSLLFHGRVGVDFLATGLVASLVTYGAVTLLAQPVQRAREPSTEELEQRVAERTLELERTAAELRLAHTERLDLETRLRMAERVSGTGSFASAVSHEIRNPLSATLGNLEMLLEMLDDDAPKGEVLEAARDALLGAEQVNVLIGDLSTLSPSKLDVPSASLAEVAASAQRLTAHVTRSRARVLREIPEDLRVALPPPRLMQIVINLLTNAAQASVGDEPNEIVLRGEASDGGVSFTVSDRGVGIAPELLGKVMEPHFTTKGEQGSGLGLAIVAEIARSVGGRVTVDSVVGTGTRVAVWLPSAPLPAGPQR